MKKLVAVFLIAILAGSVTIPNVFSDDEKNNNVNSENDNQGKQNDAKDNDTKIHFGFSSATSVNVVLPNGTTITFEFSSSTNPGQQISSFVHQIRDAFKQEETQTKQIIKDCREKAKDASPADKKNIMNECKAKLKEIKQQFRGEQRQFQLDFKQFRDLVIGNNQENHEKPNEQKDNAKIQNATQTIPKQHGLEQKLQHQNNKQKHDNQD